MEYRVLIKLFVPEIEETYEMYIPVNKYIDEISSLLCQLVHTLSSVYPVKENVRLCNRRTGFIYSGEQLIRNTDIRNGTELVLIP